MTRIEQISYLMNNCFIEKEILCKFCNNLWFSQHSIILKIKWYVCVKVTRKPLIGQESQFVQIFFLSIKLEMEYDLRYI